MFRYIYNQDLPFIKEFPGNKIIKGQFTNDSYPDINASLMRVLKWKLSPNPQKLEKKNENFQVKVIENSHFINSPEDKIVWLGHASFFIRMGGVNFITDPCFGDLPLIKRLAQLPCDKENFQNIDYLLISHGHRDHFDEQSIKGLLNTNRDIKALLPLKLGNILNKIDKNAHFQEFGWYQYLQINPDIRVVFLPAVHWNRRGMNDFNKILWGSFMIQYKEMNIYFAGDTGFASHFEELPQLFGSIDHCLLPIGAYKPQNMMQGSHMSPEEAVRAFHILKAKNFIPMHYGTYDISDEPVGEPIKKMRKMRDNNKIDGTLSELAIGEILAL